MSEMEIEVHGRVGFVSFLSAAGGPLSKQFVVVLKFPDDPLPGDITSMGVYIPGRHYEREKFIETVTRAAEAQLAKDLKQQRHQEAVKDEAERFDRYAKKVAKDLGIDSN